MKASTYVVFLLLMANLVSAIGVVVAKHESRKLFSAMQKTHHTRDQLVVEFGQLQLEESTWGAHSRIDTVARESLGMSVPVQKDIQYVYIDKVKSDDAL